jgi:hypothetical protein
MTRCRRDPGASDDGAAVASVLEIARILAARPPPRHPIVLLLTDGEEAGLLGALLFVQRASTYPEDVKAAVNLEARGTSGPSLMFETGSANGWLMRSLCGGDRPAVHQLAVLRGLQAAAERHGFQRLQGGGLSGLQFRLHRQRRPLPHAARQRGECKRRAASSIKATMRWRSCRR